jgi:tetratricopeptide (TPR) repeat protein
MSSRPRSVSPAPPRGAALLLCALALVALVHCSSQEQEIADFMARGDGYVDNEQWKEAIIEYRNVLQLDPNNADAHYKLAKAYMKTEQLKDAYWELHETTRLDPGNTEARLGFGQFNLAARDFDEALAQADGVIESEPDKSPAYVLRGQALEGLNRPDEAEKAYLKARELSPDEGALLLILASFYQRQHRPQEAEPLLRQFSEEDPGFASYTALGRFLARDRGRADEAEAAFRAALEQSKPEEKVAAYRNLAGFYFSKNRFDDARSTLEKGIQEVDDKLDLIYLLARFHRFQGDDEKADQLIEEATKARPDDVRPYLVLSAYRGRDGDLEGALEAAESALKVAPDDPQARLRKAELLVDMGYREKDDVKIAEGRSIVDAMLAQEPSDPSALFVRAKIELAEGDTESAKTALRSAIDGRPDWAEAHFVLGSALALSGDQSGARAELARAVELDPSLVEARRLLAQIHAALGEHEYAIEQGRLYLKERPDNIPVRILVAQSLVRIGRGDEALAELQAIPEEKRTADVFYALGRLHASKGELDRARSLLLRADEERPNHPDILRTLLGIDRRLGHFDESVARIEKAAKADPSNADLVLLQGLVSMMQGRDAAVAGKPEVAKADFEQAENAFKRATEMDPDDLQAYQQLAYFYQLTGQLEKTIQTYETAVQAKPDNARLHHFLGVLYELAGRQDDAMKQYGEAIERDKSLGEAMNNLAYLLAERGEDLDHALDLAQQAKALLPESANAADTLGWVLFKRGIPSAAVGYLREAEAGADPNDENLGVIRQHLALAYEANGESDKAVASLQRALETLERQQKAAREAGRQPSDPPWAGDVRSMLERLQAATG